MEVGDQGNGTKGTCPWAVCRRGIFRASKLPTVCFSPSACPVPGSWSGAPPGGLERPPRSPQRENRNNQKTIQRKMFSS